MAAFPKHRESSTLSSCTIISLARSKGVVLNRTSTGGWTAMRPVKSKLQELGCQCENYQSSPEKKSSNQDPWPSIHSRVFQPQTGVSVSLVSMRVSVCVCACWVTQSHPTLLRPHGPQSTRPLCPWDSPGKNTGGGCHFLLQGIFLTRGWNPHLLLLCHLGCS